MGVDADDAAPGRDAVTQTHRTRLHSMLCLGREAIDEWLAPMDALSDEVKEGFSDAFWRTLKYLDSLPLGS